MSSDLRRNMTQDDETVALPKTGVGGSIYITWDAWITTDE